MRRGLKVFLQTLKELLILFALAVLFASIFFVSKRAFADECEVRAEITDYKPLRCFKVITLESGATTKDKDSMVLLLSADIRLSDDCKLVVYHTRDGKPFDIARTDYACEQ
jgi:hypothetical protein